MRKLIYYVERTPAFGVTVVTLMKTPSYRFLVAVFALALATALLSCTRLGAGAPPSKTMLSTPKLDPRWVFISKNIRWKLPPKEIIKDLGSFYDGQGYLMVLYPSGELALVSCNLRKDGETNQISLNGVVDFSVAKGRWLRNEDDTLTTKSRFCMASMGPDRISEALVERRWTAQQSRNQVADLLTSGDETMIPLPENFRDVDGIAYMLRLASECR